MIPPRSHDHLPIWAQHIRALRVQTGISQTGLGVAIGLDPGVASTRINRYEQGIHEPDYQTMRRLAAALNVSVVYLYCDDDQLAEMILAFRRST